ncbi:hypothetical protein ACFX2I_032423 [Malus domestica]
MLQIFHDSQNFFLLKELEKSGPKKRSRHRRLKKVFRFRRHSPLRGTRGTWRMGRQGRHRSSSKARRRRRSIEEPPGVAEKVKAIRRHHSRNLDDPSRSNHEADLNPKSSETCCSTLLQNQKFLSPMAPRKLVEDPPGALVENFDDKDHCDSRYFWVVNTGPVCVIAYLIAYLIAYDFIPDSRFRPR